MANVGGALPITDDDDATAGDDDAFVTQRGSPGDGGVGSGGGDSDDDDDDGPAMAVPQSLLNHRGVASLYVHPPYLLDGLKFDLRLYVLLTSVDPLVCYVYDDGLCRFATGAYSVDDVDSRCVHLTNYSLNKRSKDFVANASEEDDGVGSKWSLRALRRRLASELGAARCAAVWASIDELIVKTLLAAEPSICASCVEHVPGFADNGGGGGGGGGGGPPANCFQLFGFDVMLDSAALPAAGGQLRPRARHRQSTRPPPQVTHAHRPTQRCRHAAAPCPAGARPPTLTFGRRGVARRPPTVARRGSASGRCATSGRSRVSTRSTGARSGRCGAASARAPTPRPSTAASSRTDARATACRLQSTSAPMPAIRPDDDTERTL